MMDMLLIHSWNICRDIEILIFLDIEHIVLSIFFSDFLQNWSQLCLPVHHHHPLPAFHLKVLYDYCYMICWNFISCHTFRIPAEFFSFVWNCSLNAAYPQSSNVLNVFWCVFFFNLWLKVWIKIISDMTIYWLVVLIGIKHIFLLFPQQWMTHHVLQWIRHAAWKCQVTCHVGEILMW